MRWSLMILLLSCLLFGACRQSNNSNENSKELNAPERIVKTDEEQRKSDSIYQTSTGKAFVIRTEPKGSSMMDITVLGKGFQNMKDSILIKDADPLTRVLVLDLNKDGFDEIYLITTSAGSGSYANIHGFSSNKDLSFSPIYVPEITEKELNDPASFQGYMGHDSIYAMDDQLMRKFPVYKEGDANCCPTGGLRTLAYGLYPGEASWILKME